MYGYIVSLNGEEITQENNIYESYEEAESEAYFCVDCYSDSMDVSWSEFEVQITSSY